MYVSAARAWPLSMKRTAALLRRVRATSVRAAWGSACVFLSDLDKSAMR